MTLFTSSLNIGSRGCHLIHWIFENLFIITKCIMTDESKFNTNRTFQKEAPKYYQWFKYFYRLSRFFKLYGVLLFLGYCIVILLKTYRDESDLKVAALNKMTVSQLMQNIETIHKLRVHYKVNIAMLICDLAICLNENNIYLRTLGLRMNRGVEGIMGMISSSLFLWSLHRFKSV